MLYLNDFGKDFEGGKFSFVDAGRNHTIEPLASRLLLFTSGSENLHNVFKVERGTRYALTIAFTCDKNAAVANFWDEKMDLFV